MTNRYTSLRPAQRAKRKGKRCDMCGRRSNLVLDHDHATGLVRGTLCSGHNVGLGMFHDSVDELLAAIAYLREHAPPQPSASHGDWG